MPIELSLDPVQAILAVVVILSMPIGSHIYMGRKIAKLETDMAGLRSEPAERREATTLLFGKLDGMTDSLREVTSQLAELRGAFQASHQK